MNLKETGQIGVIVARMQVPYLTDSHKKMIETVLERHQKVLLILGTTSEITPSNPFSFDFRAQMIKKMIPNSNLTILPLSDHTEDTVWVTNLDSLIKSYLFSKEIPVLYGGRESFIPYYKENNGTFGTIALAPEENDSGTELRNIYASKIPGYSREVAESMLWLINKILN